MQLASKIAEKFIREHNIEDDRWCGLIDFAYLPPSVGTEADKMYRPHNYAIKVIRRKAIEAITMGVTGVELEEGAVRNYLKWNRTEYHWQLAPNFKLPAGFDFQRDYRTLVIGAIRDAVEYFKFHRKEIKA